MVKLLSIITLVLTIILFPPAVLAVVSNNAVPGDVTYPLKRGLEDVIYAVASLNPNTKAMFAKARSDRRFQEITVLLTQGKQASKTLNELVEQTQSAADQINNVSDFAQRKKLAQELSKSITKYDEDLSKIQQKQITPSPKPTSTPVPSKPATSSLASPTPQTSPSPSPLPDNQVDPELEKIRRELEEIKKRLEESEKQRGVMQNQIQQQGQSQFQVQTPSPTPSSSLILSPSPKPTKKAKPTPGSNTKSAIDYINERNEGQLEISTPSNQLKSTEEGTVSSELKDSLKEF